MPFVTPERREQLDAAMRGERLCLLEPGDMCYVYYKEMVDRWRAEPRWTTAHNIFKSMAGIDLGTDEGVAQFLAWHVFFNIHVMHYEQLKRDANGDI
jgi:hypothetical protein